MKARTPNQAEETHHRTGLRFALVFLANGLAATNLIACFIIDPTFECIKAGDSRIEYAESGPSFTVLIASAPCFSEFAIPGVTIGNVPNPAGNGWTAVVEETVICQSAATLYSYDENGVEISAVDDFFENECPMQMKHEFAQPCQGEQFSYQFRKQMPFSADSMGS